MTKLSNIKVSIICIVLLASQSVADFPTHSNINTVDVSKVTGNFDSFKWSWISANSQTVTVYIINGSSQVDLTGFGLSFKVAKEEPSSRTSYILTTNITATTNSISFGIESTNVPAPGSYNAELLAWQGTTNLTRSVFQGMITVMKSLFPN